MPNALTHRVQRLAAQPLHRRVVDEFREGLGSGVRLDTVFDQDVYTTQRLGELASNLAAGAAVVVVIIFFMMGPITQTRSFMSSTV